MMAQLKQFLFTLGNLLVGGFAALLLMLSVVPVTAQPVVTYQITNLDRRIGALESLNLDRRIAVLENIAMNLEDNNTMHRLTMGGTSLLIAERVYAAIFRRKESDGPKE
jgi:hypothetical protein